MVIDLRYIMKKDWNQQLLYDNSHYLLLLLLLLLWM
jgi:hypothetical protein